MTQRILLVLLLAGSLLAPSPVPAQAGPPSARESESAGPEGAGTITAGSLEAHLRFVASDEIRGRDTPSRGLDLVARYLASHLARWDMRPAGDDGSYFQEIVLERTTVDPGATKVTVDGRRFAHGTGFYAETLAGTGRGPMVYAGHGWVVDSLDVDPYRGIDVKDRIVVVTAGYPPGFSRQLLARGRLGEGLDSPQSHARRHGAAGVVVVPDLDMLSEWGWRVERTAVTGQVEVRGIGGIDPREARVPTVVASPALARAIFRDQERGAEEVLSAAVSGRALPSFELDPERVLELDVVTERVEETTQNVVGIVEGRDPELRDEHVAFTAHYDHVGVGEPVDGDSIYNGADDDGSGTVALLALAEAFSRAPRPDRSLLFVWHAGEEHGLWGSRWFVARPTVELDDVIALINLDMIGRSRRAGDRTPANARLTGPDEVYLIGPEIMSRQLGEIVASVNRDYLGIELNSRYDSVDHPSRFFFRSDQLPYAARGIPALFFFTGVHEDYHGVDDEVDGIDFGKMERIVRTVYAVGRELAGRPGQPALNEELPPVLRREDEG